MPNVSWDILGAYLLQRWPKARLHRYSCQACFKALWTPILGKTPPCFCWKHPASALSVTLPSATEATAGAELRFVAYDAIPAYARPPQFPMIHLDTLFSPAAAWALTDRPNNERLVLVDPLGLATPEQRAVGRLLGGRFVHVVSEMDVSTIERMVTDPPFVDAAEELLRREATRPGDRHAVANLVGAMILEKSLPDPRNLTPHEFRTPRSANGHDIRPALRTLLERLRLLPRPGRNRDRHWFPRDRWDKVLDTFLVLDDMHDCGWGSFLFRALQVHESDLRLQRDGGVLSVFAAGGKTPVMRLTDNPGKGFGTNGATSIIAVLKDGACLRRGKPLQFCNPSKREALFLDLRLFTDRFSKEEELKFYAQLLILVKESVPVGDLLTADKVGALEKWVELAKNTGQCKEEDDNYYELLTLLPRLIAFADPLLPVVLFSSTGQRKVLKLLHKYPSIITEFDKPRFFGVMPDEMVTASRERFDAALERCIHFARGRKAVCALFDETVDDDWKQLRLSDLFDKDMNAERESPKVAGDFTLAEIYLDETGDVITNGDFGVGGIALLYQNPSDAIKLDDELRRRQLVWGLSAGYPPQKNGDSFPELGRYLAKVIEPATLPRRNGYTPNTRNRLNGVSCQNTPKDYYQKGFELVGKALKACNVRVIVFGLLQNISKLTLPGLQQTLLDPHSLDFCYRSMLMEATETMVFDVLLPLFQGKGKLEVRIDAAARTYVNKDPKFKTKIDQWWRQFAVVAESSNRFESLQPDDFYPLVTEMLARRRDLADRVDVTRARAVRLCDYARLAEHELNDQDRFIELVAPPRKISSPRPWQIHYLADWVIRQIAEKGPFAGASPLGTLLGDNGDGIRQRRDESFQCWLRAGRAATREKWATAVAEAAQGWEQEQHKDHVLENGLARWMLPQARRWVSQLDGRQFVDVCDQLPPL